MKKHQINTLLKCAFILAMSAWGVHIIFAAGFPGAGINAGTTSIAIGSVTGGTNHNAATYDANGLTVGIAPGGSGNLLTSNGTDWTSAAAPAAVAGANPTGVITGAAVNGVATTYLRSDGAPSIGAALTTADALGDVKWSPTATTQKALMLQGLASQTANVFEIQGSNGTVVFAVDVPPTTFTGTNALIAGTGAMAAATDADDTVALGAGALDGVTSGDRNVAVGKDALGAAGSGAMSDTVGLGYQAGLVTTASQNVFVGSQAGLGVVGNVRIAAVGYKALAATGGSDSTALGFQAGILATGGKNTFIGSQSGPLVVAGTDEVMVGYGVGTNVTGSSNIIIGSLTGQALTSGTSNIFIGTGATGESTATATTCVLGGATSAITNIYSNKGIVSTTATAYTINGTGGSGSDNAGANLIFAGGKGTGLAGAGYVGITYPLLTTTGSTLQTMSTLTNWVGGRIYQSTADLTLTASTSTTGTLIGAQTSAVPQGTLTLDAQFLRVGRTIRYTATGRITQSAAGPTLAIAAKLGATVIATGTIPANGAGITNGAVRVEWTLVCRSTGASGTVQGDGSIWVNTTAGTLLDMVTMYQAATTVDTTASQAIDNFGTWSANTAGNNVLWTNCMVEVY